MNNKEIKSLLEEIFFEDFWEIDTMESIIFIRKNSNKLNRKISFCKIHNGKYKRDDDDIDIWKLSFFPLGSDNITMDIPKLDMVGFLLLFKEKVKQSFEIQEMLNDFWSDIKLMQSDPSKILREHKLNKLGI